jgi:hypothetical protein
VKSEAWLVLIGISVLLAAMSFLSPRELDDCPCLCLVSRVTGNPCPACGTLHALSALLHGDFGGAWGYNRNIVLVAPLLMGLLGQQLRIVRR